MYLANKYNYKERIHYLNSNDFCDGANGEGFILDNLNTACENEMVNISLRDEGKNPMEKINGKKSSDLFTFDKRNVTCHACTTKIKHGSEQEARALYCEREYKRAKLSGSQYLPIYNVENEEIYAGDTLYSAVKHLETKSIKIVE